MAAEDLTESIRLLVRTGAVMELVREIAHEFSPSRDQLAAMAMQGFCADPSFNGSISAAAYSVADAMLSARRSSRAPQTVKENP